jgi:hypothetical protein
MLGQSFAEHSSARICSPRRPRNVGRLSLVEALELTLLIAREDPRRHPCVAARWLWRYLDECDGVTIDEAAMLAASLAALTGSGRETAVETLRAIAE